ncbi:hypothetical protein OCU04_001045 [Sclerotinia nivalis]|uniref:Uncharacterized protein n=1 Tax=Sclerotinia nivalis TaxID=352851 RepID=A0A9X0AXY5_9HELO|nr:hypothetical protein OCU04_001045 [Sclerotinia nivalis]
MLKIKVQGGCHDIMRCDEPEEEPDETCEDEPRNYYYESGFDGEDSAFSEERLKIGQFVADHRPLPSGEEGQYWALRLGYNYVFPYWDGTKSSNGLLAELGGGAGPSTPVSYLDSVGLILLEIEPDVFKRVAYFEDFKVQWPEEMRAVTIQ